MGRESDARGVGGIGFPCPHAEAHLKVEVFCPPYKAPAHGAVWYKDKRYRTVTSAAAREDKDRKKVNLFGKEVGRVWSSVRLLRCGCLEVSSAAQRAVADTHSAVLAGASAGSDRRGRRHSRG